MQELYLTLLGYPISILAGLTVDKIKLFSKNISKNHFEKLFIKSLLKSFDRHILSHDKTSTLYLSELKSIIRKDKYNAILNIFYSNADNLEYFLSQIRFERYIRTVAEDIIQIYKNNTCSGKKSLDIMLLLVEDSLRLYREEFYKAATIDDKLRLILMKTLDIDDILCVLRNINSNLMTKDDFDSLKSILFPSYLNSQPNIRKRIADYYAFLNNNFKYIEQRGFSPKVSGREVKMKLQDIFVPISIIRDDYYALNSAATKNNENIKTSYAPNVIDFNFYIDIIINKRNIVILGDPGSGKSTLLKYLIMKLSKSQRTTSFADNVVPIFLRISEYADFYKSTQKPLIEHIYNSFPRQYSHLIRFGFDYSNIVLFLDGLDEITDTSLRLKIVKKIEELISMYPFNRYIITSRIVGYRKAALLGDVTHYRIMPFSTKDIATFTFQWYMALATSSGSEDSSVYEESNKLYLSILKNDSVLRIATNPLLLTIIAMIYFRGKNLPSRRVELYDICTETFLEYWVRHRVSDDSIIKDKSDIVEIMSPIALYIHQNKSDGLIGEKEFKKLFLVEYNKLDYSNNLEAKNEYKEFLKFLEEYTGFFYLKGKDENQNNMYGFIHLTFEEYLSAIELLKLWSSCDLALDKYVGDQRWIEILRLAVAQLSLTRGIGRNEASRFVEDILSTNKKSEISGELMQLLILMLSDDVDINRELLDYIVDSVIDLIYVSSGEELYGLGHALSELYYSKYRKIFLDTILVEFRKGDSKYVNNFSVIVVQNLDNDYVKELYDELRMTV